MIIFLISFPIVFGSSKAENTIIAVIHDDLCIKTYSIKKKLIVFTYTHISKK